MRNFGKQQSRSAEHLVSGASAESSETCRREWETSRRETDSCRWEVLLSQNPNSCDLKLFLWLGNEIRSSRTNPTVPAVPTDAATANSGYSPASAGRSETAYPPIQEALLQFWLLQSWSSLCRVDLRRRRGTLQRHIVFLKRISTCHFYIRRYIMMLICAVVPSI